MLPLLTACCPTDITPLRKRTCSCFIASDKFSVCSTYRLSCTSVRLPDRPPVRPCDRPRGRPSHHPSDSPSVTHTRPSEQSADPDQPTEPVCSPSFRTSARPFRLAQSTCSTDRLPRTSVRLSDHPAARPSVRATVLRPVVRPSPVRPSRSLRLDPVLPTEICSTHVHCHQARQLSSSKTSHCASSGSSHSFVQPVTRCSVTSFGTSVLRFRGTFSTTGPKQLDGAVHVVSCAASFADGLLLPYRSGHLRTSLAPVLSARTISLPHFAFCVVTEVCLKQPNFDLPLLPLLFLLLLFHILPSFFNYSGSRFHCFALILWPPSSAGSRSNPFR